MLNIWIVVINILTLHKSLTVFNRLIYRKMLRHKENIGFVVGSAATVARREHSPVVRVEYGVILPPPIWLNYQIINGLYENDLTRSRRGLCCALL